MIALRLIGRSVALGSALSVTLMLFPLAHPLRVLGIA